MPDGGENGFWAMALGTYSSTNQGIQSDRINVGNHWILADGATTAWYPIVGNLNSNGALNFTSNSCYWTAYFEWSGAYYYFWYLNCYVGGVDPTQHPYVSGGGSVRCVKE